MFRLSALGESFSPCFSEDKISVLGLLLCNSKQSAQETKKSTQLKTKSFQLCHSAGFWRWSESWATNLCYLKLPGLMKTHHPWMRYKSWQQWWIKLCHQLCLLSSNITLQPCIPHPKGIPPQIVSLSNWLLLMHKVRFGMWLPCPFNRSFLWFCSLWQIFLF